MSLEQLEKDVADFELKAMLGGPQDLSHAFVKIQAGVETVLATANLNLTAGTRHTLAVTAVGNQISAKVDGGNLLQVNNNFNSTASQHGIVMQYDAANDVYGGPVDNFLVS